MIYHCQFATFALAS